MEINTEQLPSFWKACIKPHIQNPTNLLVYLAFTAWLKFMGCANYIPTITVGA